MRAYVAVEPCEPHLTIVSDEVAPRLDGICGALERYGVRSEVLSAAAFAARGCAVASLCYLRRLDPGLRNAGYVAQVVSRTRSGAAMINSPDSVRASEWLPLASEAFRKYDVPEPRRTWCVNDHDLRRAARDLPFPLVAEGVVSRKRVFVATSSDMAAAVRRVRAAPGSEARGVVLEQWTEAASATAAVLVVAGRPAGVRLARGCELARPRVRGVEEAATRAVGALGGHIMAAIVTCDTHGNPSVRRVDAAPDLALFGRTPLERPSWARSRACCATVAARARVVLYAAAGMSPRGRARHVAPAAALPESGEPARRGFRGPSQCAVLG